MKASERKCENESEKPKNIYRRNENSQLEAGGVSWNRRRNGVKSSASESESNHEESVKSVVMKMRRNGEMAKIRQPMAKQWMKAKIMKEKPAW